MATKTLIRFFERALRLQVAYRKCVLLASSSTVDARLRALLRDTNLRIASWGKKLGVQFSMQQRRRLLLRQRAQRARGRAQRVAFLSQRALSSTAAPSGHSPRGYLWWQLLGLCAVSYSGIAAASCHRRC